MNIRKYGKWENVRQCTAYFVVSVTVTQENGSTHIPIKYNRRLTNCILSFAERTELPRPMFAVVDVKNVKEK